MTAPRRWPERFLVTMHLVRGGVSRYYVATMLSAEKAVAMAVSRHLYLNGESQIIYDVEVEDLGPVPRRPDGGEAFGRSDLVDRYEY